jgi:hypothetical protein
MIAIFGDGWCGASLLIAPSFAALAAIVGMTADIRAAHSDAPTQKLTCQGDNGGRTSRLEFAPRYSPTISAMSATLSWRRSIMS